MQSVPLLMTHVRGCECAGGCPAGPNDLGAPQGFFAAKREVDVVTFSWSKPEVAADASALVGYYMAAMEQSATTEPVTTERVSSAHSDWCVMSQPTAQTAWQRMCTSPSHRQSSKLPA